MLINMRELSPELVALIESNDGKLTADTRAMLEREMLAELTSPAREDSDEPPSDRMFRIEQQTKLIKLFVEDSQTVWEVCGKSLVHSLMQARECLSPLVRALADIAQAMASPHYVFLMGGITSNADDVCGRIDSIIGDLLPTIRAARFRATEKSTPEPTAGEPETP